MARVITDPRGVRWRVGRRWFPWRPQLRWLFRHRRAREPRREPSSWWDALEIPLSAPDGLDDLGVVILAILGVLLLVFVVLPLTLFVVELLVVLGLLGLLALLRTVLRRPWFVDAVPVDGSEPRRVWASVGFRRSGDVVDAVASVLSRGGDTIHVDGAERVE